MSEDPLFYEALMVPGYDLPDLAALLNRPAWMRDALCREFPDVSFFTGRGEDVGPAKAICARCAVRDECLEFALAHDLGCGHGIWGGLAAQERRRLATERRAA